MAISEKSLANLQPATKETAREKGRNGGIRSGQVRRQKKKLKDTLAMLLDLPPGFANQKEILTMLGINEEDQTNQTLIAVSMIQAAASGDVKAAAFVRDTVGEKPTDKIETSVTTSPLDEKLAELDPRELRAMAGLDDE